MYVRNTSIPVSGGNNTSPARIELTTLLQKVVEKGRKGQRSESDGEITCSILLGELSCSKLYCDNHEMSAPRLTMPCRTWEG